MVQTPKRVKMLKEEIQKLKIVISKFNGKEMADLKLYYK